MGNKVVKLFSGESKSCNGFAPRLWRPLTRMDLKGVFQFIVHSFFLL